jgi:hypothetical protein
VSVVSSGGVDLSTDANGPTPEAWASLSAQPPPSSAADSAPQPIEPAEPAPAQGAAFPVAQVFDGRMPDGRPLIERVALDPREIQALTAYLTQAPVALSAPGFTSDEMVPAAAPAVPRAYHCDGTWIWPAAVGYYLFRYQLPPHPDLLAHIRSHNYQFSPISLQVRTAAANQLLAELNAPSAPVGAPQSPPVTTGSSPQFSKAGNHHAAWVAEQLATFNDFAPTGGGSLDRAGRRYRQSGREFQVDGLGSLSAQGIWTWAWADPAAWPADPAATEQARRLRAIAEREEITELVTPSLDLSRVAAVGSPAKAAGLLVWISLGLLGARGYIEHRADAAKNAGARAFYLVSDTSVPVARPTLGTLPQFLFEGPAVFGDDAAECVIGYAKHHGWEWTRVPEGVAVTAEGVGSFSAEVSDHRLIGLSLHV